MNLATAIQQVKAEILAGKTSTRVNADGYSVFGQLTDAINTRTRQVRVDVYDANGKRLLKADVTRHLQAA